jgi:hypothetical protein
MRCRAVRGLSLTSVRVRIVRLEDSAYLGRETNRAVTALEQLECFRSNAGLPQHGPVEQ